MACFLISIAAAALFAVQPPVTEAELSLARRYMAAVDAERTFDQVAAGASAVVGREVAEASGVAPDSRQARELQQAMADASSGGVRAIRPVFLEQMARIVAEVFTTEELEAMVAFYESPAGRSSLAKGGQAASLIGKALEDVQPALSAEVYRRLCADYSCTAAMRERAQMQGGGAR